VLYFHITTAVLSFVCVIHVHARRMHIELTHLVESNWHYFLMAITVEAGCHRQSFLPSRNHVNVSKSPPLSWVE